MKGIDISNYQDNVDFNQVKNSGVEVVIIKASEGMTWKDGNFLRHYDGAKAAGLKVGAYHFLRANASDDEVNNFLSVIGDRKFDCKLVIDMEIDYGSAGTNSALVRKFADILISKGYEVCLYTGEYFYNRNLNDTVKDLPLWVAKYSTDKPSVGCDYIGWQYTSSGSVPGISGNVDMNDFTEAILNSPIQTAPQPACNPKILSFQINANIQGLRDSQGRKLVEDGIMGPNTLYVMELAGAVTKKEMRTPLVGVIQTVLGCGVDYNFGSITREAVRDFQVHHDLADDGIVGINTWKELLK